METISLEIVPLRIVVKPILLFFFNCRRWWEIPDLSFVGERKIASPARLLLTDLILLNLHTMHKVRHLLLLFFLCQDGGRDLAVWLGFSNLTFSGEDFASYKRKKSLLLKVFCLRL